MLFFSDGNGLQIINLIRSAFGGHVTFVFSYIETSLESMLWHGSALLHLPAAWILSLLGALPPGPLGVTSK